MQNMFDVFGYNFYDSLRQWLVNLERTLHNRAIYSEFVAAREAAEDINFIRISTL